MRSINIRRVAAIAAGAAMIGSILASGLAVVTHSPDDASVNTLVGNIKTNLDKVNVVVGTHGAAISDGVAAAKIAAVLASTNYVQTTPTVTGITGEKSVIVETGAGVLETSTTASKKLEYTANTTAVEPTYYGYSTGIGGSAAIGANKTITRIEMPDLLKQRSLSAVVNGSSATYYYEDKIMLYEGLVQYAETTSTPAGHGLYLDVPFGSVTSGTTGIVYQIDFGTGIPVSSAYSYQETPEIYLFGEKYGLDYKNTQSGLLILASANKYVLATAETATLDSYSFTVNSISSVTTTSGTKYKVFFTVSDGVTSSSYSLEEGGTGKYFDDKFIVYIDSIGYPNTVIVRLSKEEMKFSAGNPWTLNVAGATSTEKNANAEWTIAEITVPDNKLTSIKLKYGNPSNTAMAYEFNGYPATRGGLAQGVTINGPLKADGTPFFKLQLKGFGSTTTLVDTTSLTFEGKGSEPAATPGVNDVIWTTWVSRDGTTNTLTPSDQNYAKFATSSTGDVNLVTSTPYTVINDKVIYFEGTELESGSTTLYKAKFRLGGPTGTYYYVNNINTSQNGTLSIPTTVNPISCTVSFAVAGDITLYDDGDISTTDSTTAYCDMFPEIVPFGDSVMITTAVPWMNLLSSLGNRSVLEGVSTDADASTLEQPWPFVELYEGALSRNMTIVYDSETTATTYAGIIVGQGNAENDGNITLNGSTKKYIDQPTSLATTGVKDTYLYHITPYATELDGSVTNKLSLTIGEAARNTIVEVAAEIGVAAPGAQTVKEGETVGSVKIKEIMCPTTGTVTGTYYTQSKTITPEGLVATDTITPVTTNYYIIVGGPWVNALAQGITGVDTVTTGAGASYLIADENKLLVAGYLAADTTAAADDLIQLLKA